MKPADHWNRRWVGLALALVCAGTTSQAQTKAPAQETWNVLTPADAPQTMLYRALERQARERLETRRKEVAALKTPEALRARADRTRAKFIEALGDMPEKTPLNARVVGRDQRDGYRVERVIYESRPGHHVTAALYLPDAAPPFPGVLLPCGHSQEGKAAEPYQRACILLAKNGLAVLCYDPIGQGERVQALDEQGKPVFAGSTTEHTMAGIGALLVGRCLASYRVWDGIRSLDYLVSRPDIDASRIGCTGNSGGGTMTSYLMALDDRIAVAAPSCFITSLERLFATIGPQDAEQNIPSQVAFGMDHADYAAMRAPMPTLFCVGTQDFFDIQGSWDTFREVKGIYGRLGFGERVDLFESDEPHGFTRPRRVAALRWLRRWLLKIDDAPVEPDFPIATEAQLRCTETGQVLTAFHDKSVFDLNAEREAELAKQRAKFQAEHGKDGLLREVRRLIGLREKITPAKRIDRGEVRVGDRTLRKIVFETEPGVLIPALFGQPEALNAASPLVLIVGTGREEESSERAAAEDLMKMGAPVLQLDLRGMGETTPVAEGRFLSFGADWKEAFLAQHLGRPLLGQRVVDLLSVIVALGDEVRRGGIQVMAFKAAAPVALHAAVLEPRITVVTLHDTAASWAGVVRASRSRDQLGNVVPGALAYYDLPDLATLLAPRPFQLAGGTDPLGRPIAQEKIDALYAACAKAYRDQGAGRHLTLTAPPKEPTRESLSRTVDLKIGESQKVMLSNGRSATIRLVRVNETRDPIRGAIREAQVSVEVNGQAVTLSSGNYNLPLAAAGVQLDCPITGGYRTNSGDDPWGLVQDARIRLWPEGSPWIEPGTFTYPVRQRWFASSTQMANEPVYVDGGEKPSVKTIYYHNGLDIGGAEGLVEAVSAVDGLVVSAGTKVVTGLEKGPIKPRNDVVYVLDGRGWFYRYSHLQSIDPAIVPGVAVRQGQKIGVLGKEGGSGGWSHLHFDITSMQPSGRYGTEEGYAFLWEAAQRGRKVEVIAVARPHRLTRPGEAVVLDGSKSWSQSGAIARYEWTFSDGTTASGPKVERTYDRPGSYSVVLQVTDRAGNIDYDFAIVQVVDPNDPEHVPPTIHAAYAPTFGIRPETPVTFKVRTFRTTEGEETWDFGDGSGPVVVHSDGNVNQHAKDGYAVTTHRFEKPGHYLVRVERANNRGEKATARLHVVVEEPGKK